MVIDRRIPIKAQLDQLLLGKLNQTLVLQTISMGTIEILFNELI